MNEALDLWRRSLASVLDYCAIPLCAWLLFQALFGGSQPFDLEAWWVGVVGFTAWAAAPGAPRRVPVPMLMFAVLMLVSSAVHRWAAVQAASDLAWWEVFRPASQWFVMCVVVIGVAHTLRTPERLAVFATCLTAGTLVIAAQLVFDRTRTGFLYNEGGSSSIPTVVQWSGIHQLGVVFVIGLPMVLAIAVFGGRVYAAAAGLVLSAGFMLAAFLNGSRSAIFSIAIASVLMIAVGLKEGWRSRWFRLLSAVVLLAIPSALWVGFTQYETSMRGITSLSSGRAPIWNEALRIARDHPWLGVGPGNYFVTAATETYRTSADINSQAHNQILQIAAEGGFVAAVCFVLGWFWMFRASWAGIRDRRVRQVALGVLFALVALLIRSTYDSIVDGIIGSDRIRVLVWMLFGAAVALQQRARSQTREV